MVVCIRACETFTHDHVQAIVGVLVSMCASFGSAWTAAEVVPLCCKQVGGWVGGWEVTLWIGNREVPS